MDLKRPAALKALNVALGREGFQAFYGATSSATSATSVPRRLLEFNQPTCPFSAVEVARRCPKLAAYLDVCSEDDLIGELLPMLRHLSFHRITAAGHKDKSNEFGGRVDAV